MKSTSMTANLHPAIGVNALMVRIRLLVTAIQDSPATFVKHKLTNVKVILVSMVDIART